MSDVGFMLCGSAVSYQSSLLANLLDVSEIGASRVAVDATNNADTSGGWGRVILSCIKRLKPFRATIAFSGNYDWKAAIAAALAQCTITWPIEDGYTTAGTLGFKAGVTDYAAAGQLETRMVATITITPSGAPTITPGTPVT